MFKGSFISDAVLRHSVARKIGFLVVRNDGYTQEDAFAFPSRRTTVDFLREKGCRFDDGLLSDLGYGDITVKAPNGDRYTVEELPDGAWD